MVRPNWLGNGLADRRGSLAAAIPVTDALPDDLPRRVGLGDPAAQRARLDPPPQHLLPRRQRAAVRHRQPEPQEEAVAKGLDRKLADGCSRRRAQRGSRSGISATTYVITAIAAAPFDTSSGAMRSTVSAGVWWIVK